MPRLVLPHIRYKESYMSALYEFNKEDLWTDLDREFLLNRFEDYIEDFEKTRKGLGLPLGWVSATEYWWVEGDYFLGRIDIRPNARVPKNLASRMCTELKKWTGKSWIISLSNEIGDTTLYEKDVVEQQALKNMIMKDEIIKSVLSSFEGASITDIRKIKDDYLMQADPEDLEFLISADEFGINDTD